MKNQNTFSNSKQIFAGMFALFIAVAAYLYFLNVSVVHVVMRKEAVQEQNQLRTEIAALETKYIEAQHVIAARIATLDGYNRDSEKIFVSRGDVDALVLRNN
jgi:uncharacterized membrane protein YjgN (DUF898 family)